MTRDDLLERCPWCGYLLSTLPTLHACPECGTLVDRRWRVFGGRSIWQIADAPLRFFLLVMLATPPTVLIMAARENRTMLMFAPLVVVTAIAVGVWLLFGKHPTFIAVGPEGVTIGDRAFRSAERIPWDQIGPARFSLASDVRLTVRGEWRRIIICQSFKLNFHPGTTTEVKRCIDYINHYRNPAAIEVAHEPDQLDKSAPS